MGHWRNTGLPANIIDIKKQKDVPYVGTFLATNSMQTKIGKQVVYTLEGEDGKKFGIYGFTNLNRAMADMKIGDLLRITYGGTLLCDTKYGQKDVHQVAVEVYEKENTDDLPF